MARMATVARNAVSQRERDTSAGALVRKRKEQLHELKGNKRLRFQESLEVCRNAHEN